MAATAAAVTGKGAAAAAAAAAVWIESKAALYSASSSGDSSEEEALEPEEGPQNKPRRPIKDGKVERITPLCDRELGCWLIHDVYSQAECREFVEAARQHTAPANPRLRHTQLFQLCCFFSFLQLADTRLGKRRVRSRNTSSIIPNLEENFAIAEDLFDRLKHVLPPEYTGGKLHSVSDRIRFLRYTDGGELTRHQDVYSVLDKQGRLKTTFSVMLYLSEHFGGGHTAFWESNDPDSRRVDVVPREGSVLIFDHTILHSGERVSAGRKYVLRTDIAYVFDVRQEIMYSSNKANGV